MFSQRMLVAALVMQSAWLCGQSVLDLSVPSTTAEVEGMSTEAAANAATPAPASAKVGAAPSQASTEPTWNDFCKEGTKEQTRDQEDEEEEDREDEDGEENDD